MATAITTPDNSFIKFGAQPDVDGCFDEMQLCLQVNNFTNLQFQFSISSDNPKPISTDWLLKIADTDCNVHDLQIASIIWQASLDGTKWVGYINGWQNFSAAITAGYIQEGKCFKVALYEPEGNRNTYTFPSPLSFHVTNIHFHITVGAIEYDYDNAGPAANVAALVTLLNGAPGFTDLGTWSTDGTNIFLDTTSLLVTGTLDIICNVFEEGNPQVTAHLPVTYSTTSHAFNSCSNCFIYTPDVCLTTLVKYRCNENAFGFDYNNDIGSGNSLSGFYNQVRLSMYRKNPQTISKKKVYRKSNGVYQKLSAIMEKEIPVEVDWINDDWHTKIAVALEHDGLQFYNEVLQVWESMVFDDGETYVVNWAHNDRGTNFALAPADFKIKKMPFANFNSNCDNAE